MDVCTSKVRKRFLLSLHNIWDNIWGPVGLIKHTRTETPGRCRETHSAPKRALQKRALPSHEPGGASSMAVTRVLSHNLLYYTYNILCYTILYYTILHCTMPSDRPKDTGGAPLPAADPASIVVCEVETRQQKMPLPSPLLPIGK